MFEYSPSGWGNSTRAKPAKVAFSSPALATHYSASFYSKMVELNYGTRA